LTNGGVIRRYHRGPWRRRWADDGLEKGPGRPWEGGEGGGPGGEGREEAQGPEEGDGAILIDPPGRGEGEGVAARGWKSC